MSEQSGGEAPGGAAQGLPAGAPARAAAVSAVVPSVAAPSAGGGAAGGDGGASLLRCLEALRRDGGPGLEIVLVYQGASDPPASVAALADRLLRPPANLGFALATDLGLAAAGGEYLATVNDDAVVEPGWTAALVGALAASPGAAAAQGVNLSLDRPGEVDGAGLAWNRWWQAVQIGHGGAPPPRSLPPREVFGVSATAAIYRRSALAAVAPPVAGVWAGGGSGAGGPEPTAGAAPRLDAFDPALGSYYEDVELAVRLRAAGWTALSVPAARALHAGSATGDRLGGRRALVYGNRHLVAARMLGRRWPAALPRIITRDLADLARAAATADLAGCRGVAGGWRRALARLPRWAHRGPAVVDRATARLGLER